ncbi:MAG: PIN domain-containing protein [Phycisphaerae bacterium]
MTAVDTNVLIYARDPRDPRRQSTAAELIRTLRDGVLLWQVACEYVAASRKLAPFGFSVSEAIDDLRDLRSIWTTALPDWSTFDRAVELQRRFSLSIWDALLVAACIEARVDELLTEDLGAQSVIEGVRIRNPFAS